MSTNEVVMSQVANYDVSPELLQGMAANSGTGIPAVLSGDIKTGFQFMVEGVMPSPDNDFPVLTGSFITKIVTDEGLRSTAESATAIPTVATGVAAAVRRMRGRSPLSLGIFVDRQEV